VSANIYELFASRFPAGDNSVFLRSDVGVYSYADLHNESARYARFFTGLGLKKGDRVAVQVDKTPHCLFAYFGCLRAGLIYLPLNPAYQSGELEYFLNDSEATLFVCRSNDLAKIDTIVGNLKTKPQILTLGETDTGSLVDESRDSAAEFATVQCGKDDLAAILYTSGTTGQPKGAMISHGNLASNCLVLHKSWGWRPGDVMLHGLPIFHVHGLFVASHVAILNGSEIIFLPGFDVSRVLAELPASTVYMGVPTHYTRLLAEPALTRNVCSNMRLFISGSAPLLEKTFREFQQRTGHTILERYGMTETGMNCSNPLAGTRKPGTVGPVLEGVSAKNVDDEGNELSVNETGNLLIKGENVFKGYWRMPDKTRQEFTTDGFFKTGDLVTIDDEQYVTIVGRNRDLIISGGLNVYPKEVEQVIDQMPGVQESAVIGLPHDDFGEAVTAIVVASSIDVTEAAVIDFLKQKVANFKVAKQVFFIDELPRNSMGKVQKNLLREQFG
jgi:malonyl-CoA/methylmalonyl-CoA synthetase|tara:strand:- start:2750 stop:4249 length:1500 start_codon:yes stop_codon:yes gene_type:complete